MSHLLSQSQQALLNIFSAKLRSFLAILGVMVGTASVVALVISGELATNKALMQFKKLGTELLAVSLFESQAKTGQSALLTLDDWQQFKDTQSDIIASAPYMNMYSDIVYQGHKLSGSVIAANDGLQQVIDIQLAEGNFVSFLHRYEKYCVIGDEVATKLEKLTASPLVGQQLKLAGNVYTIIGVAKPWRENAFFNENVNRSVIIPIKGAALISKDARLNNIIFKLKPKTKINRMIASLKQLVTQKSPNSHLFPRSAKQLIESMQAQGRIFTLLLGVIGGISLLVGGIGVMNVMLVSVVERKKEIGLRKAIGAKARDIWQLFLIESVVLSLLGGALGVLLGLLGAYIISLFNDWPFMLFLTPPFLGFLVSVSVGVFFGFYPALRAAKLDPIASLRAD